MMLHLAILMQYQRVVGRQTDVNMTIANTALA